MCGFFLMEVEKARMAANRSMRFEEVSMERSKSFVTALQVSFVRIHLFLSFDWILWDQI